MACSGVPCDSGPAVDVLAPKESAREEQRHAFDEKEGAREMRIQEVRRGSQISENVRCLMQAVFPPEELVSYERLLELAEQDGVFFQAFFDEEEFSGLAYWMVKDDLVYLFYLAVSPTCQSKGYGTQILNSLKLQNPGKTIVLEAESVREKADNAEQRRRRQVFYERNGFARMGFRTDDGGQIYDIMACGREVGGEEFLEMVRYFAPDIAELMAVID